MSPRLKEAMRFVTIGLAFGLVWATMQYINGHIRDFAALAGPVIAFGGAGLLMWGLRRLVVYLRRS
jgi:hypothetical protein